MAARGTPPLRLSDRAKIGQAILEILQADDPPARLLMGSAVLTSVRSARSARSAADAEFEQWSELSSSVDAD
jgi:hypothetical protein